ncbi:MAG: phosphatase PAP2 family protein [Acidimicrobiales bacterium]|nr:phosphatase PAP2 family protein [Acidimicrobiales bacterium]MCB1015915.1 phosphatase PAP2 family protein [Acidimicrobiales bacterium]MCB9372731.1 phosphatase PAP2 family protein [Microthrixaceae bacterium]
MTASRRVRALVVPGLVFLATAVVAARDRLVLGEAGLVEALNGSAILRSFPVDAALVAIMGLGTLLGVGLVAVGAAVLLRPWQAPAGVLAAGALGWLVSRTAKVVVDRGRPVEFLDARGLDIHGSYADITGAGFPSGHTTIAFAVATALVPWLPDRYRWVAWTVASVVGVARVYVAAHFPLDVVGGAALGLFLGGVVNLVLDAPVGAAEPGA